MRSLILLIAMLGAGVLQAETNRWSLGSPDGRCVIEVSLGRSGEPSYQVFFASQPVTQSAPLGLRRNDEAFQQGLALVQAGPVESKRETYELFAGSIPHVDHTLNHRSLSFRNTNNAPLVVDLAAGNEGVAFRYRFPGNSKEVRTVLAESTGFRFTSDARAWMQPYHAAGPYTPAYEDFYFRIKPGEPPPQSRGKPLGWCFPALIQIADAGPWVLLTESGTDSSYCATHLDPGSSERGYRIAFPAPEEVTRGQTNQVGPEPRWTLPWTMPWRVLVLGKNAGEIALATLVTDLAPPTAIGDVSWIRPGRASWAWWAYPEGPATAERFNEFTDFGARMGWEYTLFDAGWWKPGLTGIAAHAIAKGVAPLAWMYAGDFYTPERRKQKLDEIQAAGVRGIKVDFWCSDRQEAITAMHTLFEDAAARRLAVNLHGCTVPRGWQRTWPNLLNLEAVLGTESYFYEAQYSEKAAELNTVLPFTRNAIGPMDSTPVACTPKKFVRTTTAAHELATAIIFTSGIIHYADRPQFFESLPDAALQVMKDAPARWDETRCLEGTPGNAVVFARRSKNTWFVAGLNGTGASRTFVVPLNGFRDFRRRLALTEGPEPRMQVAATPMDVAEVWEHEAPPRGGFILRCDR